MSNEVAGIIVVDDGGYSTKVVTKDVQESFLSIKGYCGDMPLENKESKNSFIVEYLGQTYCVGEVAKYECALPLKLFSESKQYDFFDISVLVAIHQYGYSSNYCLVSVPINTMNEKESKGREARLKKSHTIKVNGVTKTFAITEVKIAPETASSFWLEQPKNKVGWIDFGSRTIGYSSTLNNNGDIRFINNESGTFPKGIESLQSNYNPKALADFIHGNLSRIWGKEDKIYLLGGGALDSKLVSYMKEHFPNAEAVNNPTMSNSLGMYELGKVIYGMD